MQVLITKINQTFNERIILNAWRNSGDFNGIMFQNTLIISVLKYKQK